MSTETFIEFPKLSRLSRECVITEKIDGTNAQIYISDDLETVMAGSRTRWITPKDDNYGFAGWVEANKEELLKLGPGRHFGEWWGKGIQRKYGMTSKVFSLFNTARWSDDAVRPACCRVVPVIYSGLFTTGIVQGAIDYLALHGSLAAPGFMKPEGVVVYHTAAGISFKKTIEKDESPKSLAA
jgi:hypothetical protein